MPSYKCVGGPNDGQYREIPNGDKEIMLRSARPLPTLSEPMDSITMDTAVNYTVTYYTLRTLAKGGLIVLRYLAPKDWSDTRAVEYQFTK